MTERRLYVNELPPEGGLVTLDESASRHVRVLRLRSGDRVELFDGRGRLSLAEITSLDESVTCLAQPPMQVEAEGARVTLVLGLPKGAKLDECVRMATELGVHHIALMQAERSVPRWDEERAKSKVARLTRIAAEGAAQCERSDVPVIYVPRAVDELLMGMSPHATGVVCGARAQGNLTFAESTEQVWCAVGPEGGFSEGELSAFREAGFSVASLGPTILRVDTAVAAALVLVGDRLRALQAR